GYALLTTNELSGAVHSSRNAGSFVVINGAQIHWDLHPLAILHDAAFVLLFVAWLISISAVPNWALWKRLESASSGSVLPSCSNCNYPTAGLTAPTCPECGNPISHSAVS